MKKFYTLSIFVFSFLFFNSISIFSQIGFNANLTSGCAPLTVTFTNTTTQAGAYQYQWSFGDGTYLTDTTPTIVVHTYTSTSNFSPYFYVYDNSSGYLGFSYSSNGSIQVDGISSINAADSTCPNDQVSFCPNGNTNSCSWNFGDGNNSNTNGCVQHSYSATATYTITLIANTTCGTYTVTKSIVVSNLLYPHPTAWSSTNLACPNTPISFNTNTAPSYTWNFGDPASGPNNTSTQQYPQHTYTTAGTYTYTLSIPNGCNHIGSYSYSVTISSTTAFPSWLTAYASPSSVCPSQQVNLYLNDNSNSYSKYKWNFGDGSAVDSVSGESVYHTYTAVATYSATCTVRNYCGKDSVVNCLVNVASYVPFPNQSWFSLQANSSPSCPNTTVNFNAPCCYNTYKYDFGDGTPVQTTNQNYANHTYGSTLKTYTASVTITNACGSDSVLYANVTISNSTPFPTQNFQLNTQSPACPNSSVYIDAPCGFVNYQYDFGDGFPIVSSSNCGQNHTYGSTIGTYTVSVTITNGCGNDSTIYGTVQISNSVTFPNQSWFALNLPSPSCPNASLQLNAPGGYSTYQWNFGDGNNATSTQEYVNHTYTATGTYTVSAIITNACGNDTTIYGTMLISSTAPYPNQSWFNLQINSSPSCPNSSVNFNAPGGYTDYVWNFGDGSAKDSTSNSGLNHIYGSTLGTYTVSVKITNGCGKDTILYGTVKIINNAGFQTQNNSFSLNIQPNPACPNDQVSMNAPNGYANYVWKFGDGDSAASNQSYANHTYTATGTYTFSIKITNACGQDTIVYGSIDISNSGTFSNWLSINGPSSGSCPNDLISFSISGANFSSYFWNFGDGDTATVTGSNTQHSYTTTGTYTVSCKVKNGCGNSETLYTTVQVTSNAPINSDLNISGVQNPACPGDQVFFVVGSGQTTYKYVWNYGDGSQADTTVGSGPSHVYAATGTYVATAVVTNGCGSTSTVSVTEIINNNSVPSLQNSDGGKNWGFPGGDNNNNNNIAGCAGDAIIFYFFGSAANNVWHFGDGDSGTAVDHMLVYGGDGSTPVTIIKHAYSANGTYMVHLTITNSCGNSVTDSMTIVIGGNQLVNGQMTTSPPPFSTCASINFLAFGGTAYGWNFGDGNTLNTSSPTASHTYASQGVYVVSVLVTNGCGNSATYSRSINVNGAGGPSVNVTANISPTCSGGSDGSAAVSVTSGQPPYIYSWNVNGQTTQSATGLSAGLYYATVTDNIGCSSTLGVNVNDPAPIVLSSATTKATCGASDGTATASITSGGTAPYTYSWSSGGTTSSVSALGWGLYSVIVTDVNGCTSSSNVSISENGAATLSVTSTTNASCYGSSTGAINMSVTGGNPPYTYAWSNASTTQNPTGLAAGNYSVMVTDNGGCHATMNATVGQPANIVATTSVVISPTCGNFDGKARATATGGTGPYTYLWDSNAASQTTQTATGLPAGGYSVTVTDSHGCTNTGVISLSNSNSPNISAHVTDVSCFGGTNGAINIIVTGGTSPYLYTWNVGPPQTNYSSISSLIPGSYIVTVQDYKHCYTFQSYTVNQPTLLTVSVTNTGSTCGNNDGTATANPSGGNPPYSYMWSCGSQTTQTATNLAVGSCAVSITDSKGCTTLGSTNITSTTLPISICMVTVDSTSTKNEVVWDKPAVTNIDTFLVYREIASVFTLIGKQPFSALSMFTDTTNGVNPDITSYRYEIAEKDSCGNTSVLSSPHRTINLSVNPHTPCGYTLFWNDYIGFPITQYRIMRDSTFAGWKAVDSVSFGTTQWVDNTCYSANDTIQYLIEIDDLSGCTASVINPKGESVNATNFNLSRSNTYRTTTTGGSVHDINADMITNIYPNPSSGMFTIDLKNNPSGSAVIKVFDVLGEEVRRINCSGCSNSITLDMSKQAAGVYYLQVSTSTNVVTKKIVIE